MSLKKGMGVSQLDRILFGPLSWIHPERVRIPDQFNRGLCRSVINQVLLDALNISTQYDHRISNGLTRLFIDNWFILPKVAFLMSCQRYRACLAYGGKLEMLSAMARQFAQLELIETSRCPSDISPDVQWLRAQAINELLCFSQDLPDAIRQRIPLLFPGGGAISLERQINPTADVLLLRLAIQHAKRYRD